MSGAFAPWFVRVFEGHSVLSMLVVLNLACAGLLISYVLKYVDAIAKVFATSMAGPLTDCDAVACTHRNQASHIHGGDLLPLRHLSLFLSQLVGRN
jgi:hypothetical protein